MPGPIMRAGKAKKEYGDQFQSIRQRGDRVSLKNSSGKRVTVDEDARVYHRGHGRFGLYGTPRDEARYKPGSKEHVGAGSYRQTDDRKRKR